MRALTACLALAGLAGAQDAAPTGDASYWVYVAAESADEVWKVVFDGERAAVAGVVDVGSLPTEIEGPHGLAVDPQSGSWFVTLAHGMPFGRVCRYDCATDELLGETELGMFPATLTLSPATGLLYCVNFNLHGRMLPSSVSVVDPEAMVEVARTTTGPMPHGSRTSKDGRHHYSCAMMSGHLFEIDALTFDVTRRLQLGDEPQEGHESTAKPTWVQPDPQQPRAFVALNGSAQIAEVDLEAWAVTRRWPTAKGPYNLDVTPDGAKLVVTYKTAGAIGIWDVERGTELARVDSTRRVTHGVVISPDGAYAFVSSEGIGAEPGAVDVLDLRTNAKVASVDVGLQAGGLAFWRIERRDG